MGYPLPVCGPLWATHKPGLVRAHPKGNALIKKICAHPLAPERSQHCEPVHRGAWGEVKGPDVHPAPKKATHHAFCATCTEHTTRNLPQVLPRGSQRESGGARQGPPINHGIRRVGSPPTPPPKGVPHPGCITAVCRRALWRSLGASLRPPRVARPRRCPAMTLAVTKQKEASTLSRKAWAMRRVSRRRRCRRRCTAGTAIAAEHTDTYPPMPSGPRTHSGA